MKGKFVTFEGTEGVGKSTQVKRLAEYLTKTGQPFMLTREPGGDEISEKIRQIILDAKNGDMTDETEALLFAASRAQHVKHIILPALEEGKIVICDRYVDSSIVYQSYGRGLSKEYVLNINEYALKNCPPDLTILLDMPPKEAFKRKGGSDVNDRIETAGDDFFNRVNNAYSSLKQDKERVYPIDPSGTIEETHELILNALRSRGIIK